MAAIICANSQPKKKADARLVGEGKVIVIDEAWTSSSDQHSIVLALPDRPGKSVAINPFTKKSLAEKIHNEHDTSST